METGLQRCGSISRQMGNGSNLGRGFIGNRFFSRQMLMYIYMSSRLFRSMRLVAIGEKVVEREIINKHKDQGNSLRKECWDVNSKGENQLDQHGQTETANRRDMET